MLKLIITTIGLLIICLSAIAEVPQLINYQGKLTDDTGNAVEDGQYELIFSIYDVAEGGEPLWTSNPQMINVTGGLFNYQLGFTESLPDDIFGSDTMRYLGINIGQDEEILPRSKLTSVAYAYQALRADTASVLLEGGSSGWRDDGSVVRLTTGSDNVGIGTASPQTKLHINGQSLWLSGGNGAGLATVAGSGLRLFYNETGDWAQIIAYDYGASQYKNLVLQASGGNVGIGITNPAELLDINGGLRLGNTTSTNSGTIRWSGSDFEGHNGMGWISLTSGGSGGGGWTRAGSIVSLTNPSDSVGVGVTAPNVRFEVQGNDDAIRAATTSNIDPNFEWIQMRYLLGIGPILEGSETAVPSPRLTLDAKLDNMEEAGHIILGLNGDNVGIMTTSPNWPLEVDGSADFQNQISLGNGNKGIFGWGTLPIDSSSFIKAGLGRALWLGADNSDIEGISININGDIGFSGKLDLSSHRIVNLADPANAQDAATKNYVDNQTATGDGDWEVLGNNIITGHGGEFPSGNVGIGTSSPNVKLEVRESDSSIIRAAAYSKANPDFNWVQLRYFDIQGPLLESSEDYYPPRLTLDARYQDNTDAGRIILGLDGDNVGIGESDPNQSLIITNGKVGIGYNSSAQDAATLAVNGDVGIGTSSPFQKLVVGGKVGIDYNEQTQTAALAVNGDVGIGTFLPNEKLDVVGNLNVRGNVKLNGNWLTNDGDLEGVYIDTDGNVGIGTSSPLAKLDVTGNIKTNGHWLTNDGDAEGIYIASDGKVGIGTNSPSEGLEVLGDDLAVRATSSTDDSRWIDMLYHSTLGPLITTGGEAKLTLNAYGVGGTIVLGRDYDKVGICVDTPLATLDVKRDIRIRGGDIIDSMGYSRIDMLGNGIRDLELKNLLGVPRLTISLDETDIDGNILDVNCGASRIFSSNIYMPNLTTQDEPYYVVWDQATGQLYVKMVSPKDVGKEGSFQYDRSTIELSTMELKLVELADLIGQDQHEETVSLTYDDVIKRLLKIVNRQEEVMHNLQAEIDFLKSELGK